MIPQGEFHAIMRAVAHSASSDKTRAALGSVFFEFLEDSTRVVSTDGHRITVATLSTIVPPAGAGSFLAPIADIKELLGIFKHKSDKRISFVQGDALIVTNGKATLNIDRVENETFPDYRQVLPGDGAGTAGVVRFASKYLAQAIKACDGLIGPGDSIDIITRADMGVGNSLPPPTTLRPVLDPILEVLQSLDIHIMPQRREG